MRLARRFTSPAALKIAMAILDEGGNVKAFDPVAMDRARAAGFTPHVAQNTSNRRSAIDGRTTRHRGYTASQRIRKRIEEPFGWVKTITGRSWPIESRRKSSPGS